MKTIPLIGLNQMATQGAILSRLRALVPAVRGAMFGSAEWQAPCSVADGTFEMSGFDPATPRNACALEQPPTQTEHNSAVLICI